MLKLLENFSICSMMPFRDLGMDRQGSSRGQPGHPWIAAGRTYRVWEVALVTASTSWSFSILSRCSWCSWSLHISRMDALRNGRGQEGHGSL